MRRGHAPSGRSVDARSDRERSDDRGRRFPASGGDGKRKTAPLGRRERPLRMPAGEQHLKLVSEQLALHSVDRAR